MRVAALDLGTKTGWAFYEDGGVSSGTWTLATENELREHKKKGLDRCCELRPARLQKRIQELGDVDVIYFEDVQFLKSQAQAQLWSGFRAIVTLFWPKVGLRAVPVGTLKKFATGFGNAKKEHMAQALVARHPCYILASSGKVFKTTDKAVDDNEVDALHLLDFAKKELNLI